MKHYLIILLMCGMIACRDAKMEKMEAENKRRSTKTANLTKSNGRKIVLIQQMSDALNGRIRSFDNQREFKRYGLIMDSLGIEYDKEQIIWDSIMKNP